MPEITKLAAYNMHLGFRFQNSDYRYQKITKNESENFRFSNAIYFESIRKF